MSNKTRGLYLKGCYKRFTKQWENKMKVAHNVAQEWARKQLRDSIKLQMV